MSDRSDDGEGDDSREGDNLREGDADDHHFETRAIHAGQEPDPRRAR